MSETIENAEVRKTDFDEYMELVRRYGKISTLELLRTIDALYQYAAYETRVFGVLSGCRDCGVVYADMKTVQICAYHAQLFEECNKLRRKALDIAHEKGCNGKILTVKQEGEGVVGGTGQAQELREETQVRE